MSSLGAARSGLASASDVISPPLIGLSVCQPPLLPEKMGASISGLYHPAQKSPRWREPSCYPCTSSKEKLGLVPGVQAALIHAFKGPGAIMDQVCITGLSLCPEMIEV